MTKIRIVTHNAGFHADDVFGVTALTLLFGKENIEVIRTRDPAIIATGDYVLDVGDVYDPENNRFDHHQRGGAGARENAIPYAAFGLVWKKFGADIAGSAELAEIIDRELVQPIDAWDNGVSLYTSSHPSKVTPVSIGSAITSFEPAWGEERDYDRAFSEAVAFTTQFLLRKITHTKANVRAARIIREAYEKASDKKLILVEVDSPISRGLISAVLCEYSDTIFFVRQHENGTWQVVCVGDMDDHFARRKDLPESWAGKRGVELAEITGVPDALFCHNKRFMAVAESKEGALALARLALEA
ncbi:MAG: MYG1 family protein [Candidatus Pacebacteria bacterium]|nr:MYG1 family protein [Candidatus Paceibacterota bacterium]